MVEGKSNKLSSQWWWFESLSDNAINSKRSPWLQSTLAEFDDKAKGMLKLIEEDADSFAQRAEMYYRKRPELINMVEDFYRAYRSLAERYDQVKSERLEPGTRLLTPWTSPLSFVKYQPEKLMSVDKAYDSFSETYDPEESGESEVDDPEQEEESEVFNQDREAEEEVTSAVGKDELMKLREEVEKLKQENRIQREKLVEKDEEKRDVIRQLSLAMEMLKDDNVNLRKAIARDSINKQNAFQLNKLKDVFWGKLFNVFPKSEM